MGVRRLLSVASGVLLLCGTACGSSTGFAHAFPPPSAPPIPDAVFSSTPPSAFIALDDRAPIGQQAVALYDAATAAVQRTLVPGSIDGMAVVSLALQGTRSLWVTYSRGPRSGGDSLGGDPQPHSCANEVVKINLSTGRGTTVLTTGDDESVTGAWPSPDGRFYVYAGSVCADSYFNAHLTVVDTGTGNHWTIGDRLSRCHALSAPAWSPDSRSLVLTYGKAGPLEGMPSGACPPWSPPALVVVDALDAQPGLTGKRVLPDPGCGFAATTATALGMYGLEQCASKASANPDAYIDGPVWLLRFDANLHPQERAPLGECGDGGELATDSGGSSLLVSAYLYCNPPGTSPPVTRLWTRTAQGLTLITEVPGDALAIPLITW